MGKKEKTDGKKAEELAARFLVSRGMAITGRNFRSRWGEVDLVGLDGECLVFVEVKARGSLACGYPSEAVARRKQQRICRAADYYCYCRKVKAGCQIRFDVVEILGDKIRHIKNAFDYC